MMYLGLSTRLTLSGGSDTPTLTLDLLKSALDGRLSFARASAATDIINGTLTTFSTDQPRISATNGLLLEENRTNLSWNSSITVGNNVTVTGGQTDPLGGSNAVLVTEDTSTASHVMVANTNLLTGSTKYSISCFVKPGTCNRVQLASSNSITSSSDYMNFYLSGSGSISASGGTMINGFVQALANGWYRIGCTYTTVAAPGTANTLFLITLVTGSETKLPAFTGTSRTVYAYGIQTELGAFATSYIPTTSANATRATDICSMAMGALYNASEGTLLAEARTGLGIDTGAATSPRLLRLDDGTSNNVHEIRRNAADSVIKASTTTSGVDQAVISGVALGSSSSAKIAYAYKNNDMAFCQAGGSVGTDTTSPNGMPAGTGTLRLGARDASSGLFNGYLRGVKYWNQRKSNAQLQGITS